MSDFSVKISTTVSNSIDSVGKMLSNAEFNLECPNCHSQLKVKIGKNKCYSCHKTIDVK